LFFQIDRQEDDPVRVGGDGVGEHRHLGEARRAPVGPEGEDDDVPPLVLECAGGASLVPDDLRAGAAGDHERRDKRKEGTSKVPLISTKTAVCGVLGDSSVVTVMTARPSARVVSSML